MPTLNWIGKDKVISHHNDVPFRVLDRKYTYGDTPDSGNMIIHGDNLEALKALLPKYEGRVNCIYIDPPYNTGNEGWVYNDNVNDPRIRKWLGQVVGAELDDLTRHDKWLCMMYPRLTLLKRLLSTDGVIFISIDDNEIANLRIICDEIFGKNNFISQLTIESGEVFGTKAAHVNKTFVKVKDYVVAYSGSSKALYSRIPLSDASRELFDTHYSRIYKDGKSLSLIDFLKTQKSVVETFRKYNIPLKKDNVNKLMNIDSDFKNYIYSDISDFLYTDQPFTLTIEESISEKYREEEIFEYNGYLLYKTKKGSVRMLLCFKDSIKDSDDYISQYGRCSYRGDLWKGFHIDMRNIGDEGGVEFKNAKKPERLIRQLLKWANNNKNGIILDSFAGSGSTAHAVLKLNNEDGGNRRFILCEMMDYAETITATRVRNVINGYGEGKNKVQGTGGSFDYYELGTTIFDPKTGMLNNDADTEKIREYVWYSETNTTYVKPEADDNQYLLGHFENNGYYFYYEKDEDTTLDKNFLRTIKIKAERYIIYADRSLLTKEELERYKVVFKKIPRDIKKL